MQLFNIINLHLSIYLTTNVTAKSQLHFCTKQITAEQYCGHTRAAVKLFLFKDNDFSFSIEPVITIKITEAAEGKMSDKSS